MFLILANQLKKETRFISDFMINQFLLPWDQQLSNLAKELTRVFYLENDYMLITRVSHGVLDGSKYSKRIIQKTLEALLRRLEEISPDLEKFLAFNERQLRIIDQKLKKFNRLLEARDFRDYRGKTDNFGPVQNDFINTLHEYYLFVKNVVEELRYDSNTKREIYQELSNEILKANKQKGLEMVRFYMICLQNSSLLMDIKQISSVLTFASTLASANLESELLDEPTLHSQLIGKILEIN